MNLVLIINGDPKAIVEAFNSALLSVSYENYPIIGETNLKLALQMLLLGSEFKVAVEVENAKGRADLI